MPSLITNPEELKFTERNEILFMLGNPPSWLLHYGITAIAAFFGILFLLSYVIKYPDVVPCKVVFTTQNPPIRVLAQNGGRVSKILVQENEKVATDKILAVMENTGNWHDVLQLENILSKNDFTNLNALHKNLNVGSLQSSYSTLTQNLKDYNYFSVKTDAVVKTEILHNQITSLHDINENLLSQRTI